MRLAIFLIVAAALHAEDAPAPTVEQLQAQLAAKDQQIAQLQADLQTASDQYLGCVVSRQNMRQRPALNPVQQRMMERAKPPDALKPKEESK